GDSGSILSVSTFFTFSCTMLVAGNEGTISLSRMIDFGSSAGSLSALCATLSGITSPRSFLTIHQHSSGRVRTCDSGKPKSVRMTDIIQDTRFLLAIPASCSVYCPARVWSQYQHSRILPGLCRIIVKFLSCHVEWGHWHSNFLF